MTLKQILEKTEWYRVEKDLHYYDDKEENYYIDTDKFKKVYEELKLLTPSADKSIEIVIEWCKSFVDEKDEICVDGFSVEENIKYALDLSDWEDWLGWEVSKQAVNDFNFSQIVAHCLWEMTWYGFDQKTIQDKVKEFIK